MAGFGEPKKKKKKKSAPQGEPQTRGEDLHKTALGHHMRGDLVSAEKAYRAAIKTGYLHSAIFSNLGVICKDSGRSQEAISLYKKALEVTPNDSDSYTNLGNSYKDLGQLDQALASTLKSLELKPDNPTAHMNLGGIYKELTQLDQALASTLKSLELKPDNPDAHMNLGGIYQDLGQLDQALASTLKSLELRPDNPTAHMNLGGIYKELTQLDQALASTLKSLELNPGNPTAHMNLGGIYRDLGQLDQALASTLKSLELKPDNPDALMNLGGIYKELTQLDQALASTLKSLELNPDNPDALMNLGGIYKDLTQLDQALASTLKSLELKPDSPGAHMNLGGIYKELAQLDQALASTLKSLELNPGNPTAHMNLGGIYRDLGQLDQALASTLKSLELKPDNPDALMNLGGIYKDLTQLDQALASTLKSLELKPDNPDALMNLGGIYKDLTQLDQALASTLKSLELKPDSPGALNNLIRFVDELSLNSANTQSLTKAYELLISLVNISHSKLTKIFTQAFLPIIEEAAKRDPIISADNNALTNLAEDWRLRKSLTLLIPPDQAIEHFLTRLRKELLVLAANQKPIRGSLKSLTESLAMQCFLNDYVYAQSQEEEELVNQLIHAVSGDCDSFNKYLAIVACYVPIHRLRFNQDWLEDYPTDTYESRALIESQLREPQEEENIKSTIQVDLQVTDTVSTQVQDMYEMNPYPRYRYADFTDKSLACNISKAIEYESTKINLQFPEVLTSHHSQPKVLIAGCGTGNQVIMASRYKNAQITAIDLSSSSLAYANRKAKEYGMFNIDFKKMDLLDLAALNEKFDTIECSGVLHHMEDPAKGLSALSKQLKPGGYIKLGLYSEIARQDIVKARNQIKQLGIASTTASIRVFRQQVLRRKLKELANLPNLGRDFYSLSECRDLCFHVQEHRFTTRLIQELLAVEGLIFCGFMLTEAIRKAYQQKFPTDIDMTSLENWGDFEKQNPTTFRAMYQFWVGKPS